MQTDKFKELESDIVRLTYDRIASENLQTTVAHLVSLTFQSAISTVLLLTRNIPEVTDQLVYDTFKTIASQLPTNETSVTKQ